MYKELENVKTKLDYHKNMAYLSHQQYLLIKEQSTKQFATINQLRINISKLRVIKGI